MCVRDRNKCFFGFSGEMGQYKCFFCWAKNSIKQRLLDGKPQFWTRTRPLQR